VAQSGETDLKVQGQGVVDLGSHAALCQERFESIAAVDSYDELIVDMKVLFQLAWQFHLSVSQKTGLVEVVSVSCRIGPSGLRPTIQMAELDPQNCGLERV